MLDEGQDRAIGGEIYILVQSTFRCCRRRSMPVMADAGMIVDHVSSCATDHRTCPDKRALIRLRYEFSAAQGNQSSV